MPSRYRIQFPPQQEHDLAQDEAYFNLVEQGTVRKILFHDYDRIFSKPGLYEQLFYERLKCTSPKKVSELLHNSLTSEWISCSELRVLDLEQATG